MGTHGHPARGYSNISGAKCPCVQFKLLLPVNNNPLLKLGLPAKTGLWSEEILQHASVDQIGSFGFSREGRASRSSLCSA